MKRRAHAGYLVAELKRSFYIFYSGRHFGPAMRKHKAEPSRESAKEWLIVVNQSSRGRFEKGSLLHPARRLSQQTGWSFNFAFDCRRRATCGNECLTLEGSRLFSTQRIFHGTCMFEYKSWQGVWKCTLARGWLGLPLSAGYCFDDIYDFARSCATVV